MAIRISLKLKSFLVCSLGDKGGNTHIFVISPEKDILVRSMVSNLEIYTQKNGDLQI